MSSVPQWLSDALGLGALPRDEADMRSALRSLERLTTDDSASAAVRAAKVYLEAVRCVAAGGSVVFRAADGSERVLKVRLR